MKRCLLISFFNSHNIGDRLIAHSLTQRYQSYYKVVRCSFEGSLDIWSEAKYQYSSKDVLKRVYGNCLSFIYNIFPQNSSKEVILDRSIKHEIEKCDIVFIGGGNMLMYDYYHVFKSYIEYARLFEKKVFAVDIGVGPFSNEEELINTCKCLDLCQSATFRDRSSLELAKKYCINDRLFLAVDPCFFVYRNKRKFVCKNEKEFVAINVMNLRLDFASKETQTNLIEAYEILIEEFEQITKKKIVLYSTVYEDYHVIRKLAKRLLRKKIDIEIKEVYLISDLEELYQKTCYVVAMRMHALILAYSYGIPHCGIAWQKKIKSFFEITHQQEKCFDVRDLKKNIHEIVLSFVKEQEADFPAIKVKKEILDLEKVDLNIVSEIRGENDETL